MLLGEIKRWVIYKEGSMYSLFKGVAARKLLVSEAPSLAASIAIAELFYKFHSFTLEAIGFLATWYILSFLLHLILQRLGVREAEAAR
jgi:hypothetical protein